MNELTNPHDRFFKESFSRPEVARDFLSNYLPPAVVSNLDLNTLNLQSDSFIDPDLQAQYSDLLYQVETADGQPGFVYLLLEHKSNPDPLTPFQLLRYLVRIWERALRDKVKQLPPIIPLVIYHGRRRWRVATDFGELFKGAEALRPYWPTFRYEVQDLGVYSDEEIQGMIRTQLAVLLLKNILDPRLNERLPYIFGLFEQLANKQTALEYLETMLRYLSVAAEGMTPEVLSQALEETLGDEEGEIMPTLAERWIEQGMQQGMQQGVQALRDSILESLSLRFDMAPAGLAEQLAAVHDLDTLRALLRQSITADSLATFEQFLADLLHPPTK